jgi:hypothetical protein
MISQIKGMIRGNKVGKQSADVCSQLMNFLGSKNAVSLGDLKIILSESFSFCLTIANLNPRINTIERGQMHIASENWLREWITWS